MKRTNFENLEIYKLSEILADEVWNIVSDWKNLAQDTVGKQIIRSADSIGANIAEGSGRGTAQENRRFLRMARGSLYKTRHWLRRAYKRNLISSESTEKILPIINELVPKLNSYLNKITETIRQSGKT